MQIAVSDGAQIGLGGAAAHRASRLVGLGQIDSRRVLETVDPRGDVALVVPRPTDVPLEYSAGIIRVNNIAAGVTAIQRCDIVARDAAPMADTGLYRQPAFDSRAIERELVIDAKDRAIKGLALAFRVENRYQILGAGKDKTSDS